MVGTSATSVIVPAAYLVCVAAREAKRDSILCVHPDAMAPLLVAFEPRGGCRVATANHQASRPHSPHPACAGSPARWSCRSISLPSTPSRRRHRGWRCRRTTESRLSILTRYPCRTQTSLHEARRRCRRGCDHGQRSGIAASVSANLGAEQRRVNLGATRVPFHHVPARRKLSQRRRPGSPTNAYCAHNRVGGCRWPTIRTTT